MAGTHSERPSGWRTCSTAPGCDYPAENFLIGLLWDMPPWGLTLEAVDGRVKESGSVMIRGWGASTVALIAIACMS